MEEIHKNKNENTIMSKEILDRKGLSLKKVLSSIPLKKLENLIKLKEQSLQKVFDKLIDIDH